FSRSSSSQYISIESALRTASDPAGTFRVPELLQASTSPETGSRWGDYSGLEEDPSSPGKYWSHNEFRTSGWRTWIGEFELAHDLDLSVSPITVGGVSVFTAANGAVGENIHFLVSRYPGIYAPPQLGGLALDIVQPIYRVGADSVNAFGTAEINVSVPSNAPLGTTAYVQAVARRGAGGNASVKSNLVAEVIN
ncbi:MAG: hypothetical protein OTI37_04000, partial [Planctomycetota bacterium]|nr:hypothetical protein [Planctomycetota bacterium]